MTASVFVGWLRTFSFVGIGFYWAWIYYALFNTELFNLSENPAGYSETSQLASFAVYVAVMFVAVIKKRPLLRAHSKPIVSAIPLSACLGTAVMVVASWMIVENDSLTIAFMLLGAALSGLGTAYLLLMWGRLYIKMNPRSAMLRLVASLLTSALVYLILTTVPMQVSFALCLLLPLLSWVFCRITAGGSEFTLLPHVKQKEKQTSKLAYPWRLGISLAATGLAYGWVMGLSFHTAGADFQSLVIIIVNSLLAVLMLAVTLMSKRPNSFNSVYLSIVPLMGVALVLLGIPDTVNNPLPFLLARASYSCFDILIWLQLPNIFIQTRSTRLFSFSRLCLDGSALLGTMVTRIAFAGGVEPTVFCILLVVFSVMFFVVLAVALTNRDVESAWSLIPILRSEAQDLSESCKLLASRYHLTSREEEIMVLLARGRSAAYIESKLEIKLSTVQSHSKNLYRKLDVHSRQDLLDLIEKELNISMKNTSA
jgi:DNA-binding CsgD family transcriptional regulator